MHCLKTININAKQIYLDSYINNSILPNELIDLMKENIQNSS